MPMTTKEALELVLELAEQNVIDDPDMEDEAERQRIAIAIVTVIAGNIEA